MWRSKRRGWLGSSPVNKGRKITPRRGPVLLENGRDVLEYKQGPFCDTNAPLKEFSDIRIMTSEETNFRHLIRDKSYAARPDVRERERDKDHDNYIERHTDTQRFDRGRKRARSPDRGKFAKRARSTRDRGRTERDRESVTWYLHDLEQRRTHERDINENEAERNRDWINDERSRMRSESPDNRYINDSDRLLRYRSPIQEREFSQRESTQSFDWNNNDRSPCRERRSSGSPVRRFDYAPTDCSRWSPESSLQGRGYSDDSLEGDWHNARSPRGYDENDRNRINENVSYRPGQWNDGDINVYMDTGKFRLQNEPSLEEGEWPQSPSRLGQDQLRYPDADRNLFFNRAIDANLTGRSMRQDGLNSYSAAPLNWTTQGGSRLEPEQQRDEHINDRRKSLESIIFDSTKSLEEQLQSKDFKDDVAAEILGILSEKRYSTGDLTGDLTTADLLTLLRKTTKINFTTLEHLTSFLTEQDSFFDLTNSSTGSFVIPKTGIHVCQEYVSRNKNSCAPSCSALHICKFYLFGTCNKQETCTLGHDLFSDHNMPVLKHARLHRCNRKDIKLLISEADNRNLTTLPIICKFYNNKTTCKKPQCPHLHICKRLVTNDCKFGPIKCFRNHYLNKPHCNVVLDRFGLNSLPEHQLICLLKKTLSNTSTNTLRYYSSVTPGSSDRKQSTAVPSHAEKIRSEMKLVEEKIKKKKKMIAKENGNKDTVNVNSENNNIISLTCPTLLTVNSPASLSRKKSPSPPSYTTYQQSAHVLSRLECTSESESYSRTPSARSPRYRSNSPNSPKYSPISPVYTETSSQHQTECQLSPGNVVAYQDNEPLSLNIIQETGISGSATSDDTPTSKCMALGTSTHPSGSPNSHQAIERTSTDTLSISEQICGQLEDGRVNNGNVNNSSNYGDTNICPSNTGEAMELDAVTEQYLPETVESPENDNVVCNEPENEGNMQTKQSVISNTETGQFPSKAVDLSIQQETIIGKIDGGLQNDKTADVIENERTTPADDHQEDEVPNAPSIMKKVQDNIIKKDETFGTLSLDSLENDVTLHSNLTDLQDRNKDSTKQARDSACGDEIAFSPAHEDQLDNGIKEEGKETESALIYVDTGIRSFQKCCDEECMEPKRVNTNLEHTFKEEDPIGFAETEKTNYTTDPVVPVCIINTVSSDITIEAPKRFDNLSEIDHETEETLRATTLDLQVIKTVEESVVSEDLDSDLINQVHPAFDKDPDVKEEVHSLSTEVDRHVIDPMLQRRVSIHREGTDIVFTCQDNQWHVIAESGLSQPVHDQFADVIEDAFSRLLETSKSILSLSVSNDSVPLSAD